MIITNVCLLLEMLSITMCLHQLYGEKYRLDIATVSLLAVDMIMMQAIEYFGLPSVVSLLIYPIIGIYCGVKFGLKPKPMVVNILLCVVIVGGIQTLGLAIIYYMFKIQFFSNYKLLLTNCMMFVVVVTVLPSLKVGRLSKFLQENGKMIILAIVTCLAWVSFWMLSYKDIKTFELRGTIMLFISIALVLALAWQLGKYKIKAIEAETELRMHELYSESFRGLIENIRLRQHEFDNHINAIYSQHFSCHTYEELVIAQKKYCEHMVKDNRFSKLLAMENSVVRGFLYGRFLEIERQGIEVSYQVTIGKLEVGIPIYKIIEILGDLINNAVEALINDKERHRLHVAIVETDGFYIEVRNESPYIEYSTLSDFFNKGYSKKGENRGLGLYNIKQICENYGLEIISVCKEIDGNIWLSFKMRKIF